AGLDQARQGGQRGADASVVGDGGPVQRDVEVRSDEHALAAQLSERVDGLQHCGAPSKVSPPRRAAAQGSGDERSPPGTDPSGRRPAGSGAVLVVSATTPGSEGLADELRELDEAV